MGGQGITEGLCESQEGTPQWQPQTNTENTGLESGDPN